VCARGAWSALLGGPSTSPLEVIIVTQSLKLALVVGTTAVVSAVAGYLVAGYQLSTVMPMAFTGSYLSAASNAVIDVRTLRAIHDNDLAKATSILEARIDSHLIHLSLYNDAGSTRVARRRRLLRFSAGAEVPNRGAEFQRQPGSPRGDF
jgi:hypothetical protein